MKLDELAMAKMMINRLYEKYPTMFRDDGGVITVYEEKRAVTPTQAKNEIRYIRRLLLEVSKEL